MPASGVVPGLPRPAVYALGSLIAFSGGAFLFANLWESQRIWANFLVASYGLLVFGLGGAVLLALLFVAGARWSDSIRPVAEKLTLLLPAGAAGMLILLVVPPAIYLWPQA